MWIGLPMGIEIALAVADKHALGAVIKFGCRAIASPNKTDAITFRNQYLLIFFQSPMIFPCTTILN
jgi:hypothetical protein